MPKAGRNTPYTVLAYIDAVWIRYEPADPVALAQELGYDPKAIRKLKEKHGEKLLVYLERVARARADIPRFMARQQGQLDPPQYVESHHGAIDDAECIDEVTQRRQTHEARARELQAKGDLLAAAEELKAALSERIESSPEFLKLAGQDIWLVRSKLDRLIRNVRRKAA